MIIKRIPRVKHFLNEVSPNKEPFNEVTKVIIPITSEITNPWDDELKSLYDRETLLQNVSDMPQGSTINFYNKAVKNKVFLVTSLMQAGDNILFNFKAFKQGVLASTDKDELILIFLKISMRHESVYENTGVYKEVIKFLTSSNRKFILAYSENGQWFKKSVIIILYFEEGCMLPFLFWLMDVYLKGIWFFLTFFISVSILKRWTFYFI